MRDSGTLHALSSAATHIVDSDLHGDDLAGHLCCLCVVLFAEGHDIHTLRYEVRG